MRPPAKASSSSRFRRGSWRKSGETPIFSEMRDLAREQLLAELRALRPEFEREGVAHLALFGSRARGDHRPDSDVDLIVDVAEGRKFGLEAVGVALIVEDNLGFESSIVTRRGLNEDPTFRDRVTRDEIRVF